LAFSAAGAILALLLLVLVEARTVREQNFFFIAKQMVLAFLARQPRTTYAIALRP
jgi:hypothetical protein